MYDGRIPPAVQVTLVLLFVGLLFGTVVWLSVKDSPVDPVSAAVESTPTPATQDPDSSVPLGTPDFHGIPYEPYENNGFNQATYEARLTANPTYTLGNFEE